MKKIIILTIYLISACSYQIDEVISEHTNYSAEFSENDITIEFLLEEMLIPYLSPQEYLLAARTLQKNLIDNSAYDHIIVFIASSDTLSKVQGLNPNASGVHTSDTDLGDYIILINTRIYEYDDPCYKFLDCFLHELTHAVIEEKYDDPDNSHERESIWIKQREITQSLRQHHMLCQD